MLPPRRRRPFHDQPDDRQAHNPDDLFVFTVRVSDAMRAELDRIAASESNPTGSVMRRLLSEGLDRARAATNV